MKPSRLFIVSLILLALLAAGLRLKHNAHDVATSPSPATSASRSTAPASSIPASVTSPKNTSPAHPSDRPAVTAPVATVGVSTDDILSDPKLDDKGVRAGLAAITLDTDRSLTERTQAMSHLLNLSAEEPAATLLPLVTDARLPDSLCNQVLDDALNAPLAWQADVSLAVLTHRQSKDLQAKAHEHLTFLIGTDYGNTPAEWTKAIATPKQTWAQQ